MTAPSPSAMLARIPGPSPMRVWGRFGNTFQFGRDTVGHAARLFAEYGPLVSLSTGGGTRVYSPHPECPGSVLAFGPDATREVTSRHETFHKAHLSGRLYPLGDVPPRKQPLKTFAAGLFGVNDQEHRRQRRLMQPAFHRDRLVSYLDDMVAITDECLSRWESGWSGDVAPVMQEVTRRIASKTLFGEDEKPGAGQTGMRLQIALRLLSHPLTRMLPLDLPGLPYRRFLNEITQLEHEVRAIIDRKRKSGAGDRDVLAMLLQARDEDGDTAMSEEELIGHVGVMFAAGHETSANALTWTLFLLSQHPEIRAAVCEEARGVLRGEAPRAEQLPELQLLERVIRESMRLLPPVPWNARYTTQPTEVLGHELPVGTEIFLSIYQTHHMPELYPQPERFNPARWETIDPGPHEYNPFSAGPRMCIGATFAMIEIKVVLSMLLQQFRPVFVPDRRIDRIGNIVMSPRYGMPMRMADVSTTDDAGVGTVRGNVREMVTLP